MSYPCRDSAEFCDHGDINFGFFAMRSSILSTRKRKFSQFFAAAAAPDTLPSHEIANPNAPKANPNDLKSYDHSDLLQYVFAPRFGIISQLFGFRVASVAIFFGSYCIIYCFVSSVCQSEVSNGIRAGVRSLAMAYPTLRY